MSGHSKWSNIKRKKEAADGKKAQIYSKLGKEITIIVKQGGPDPAVNSKLRDAIAKAKANNMPNDNITRCIQKAAGSDNSTSYEEVTYEGFGPAGVAVIVEAMTDNRNRAAADIRCIFDRSGGTLGQTGSVGYMFSKKGILIIENSENVDEQDLMMLAIDAGAEDFNGDEECYEIVTAPENFTKVMEALQAANYELIEAEIKMIPSIKKELTEEEENKFENFIDKLEDNDDVQSVWHNADI